MVHPVTLVVCSVVSIIAVVSGPFGTYEYLTLAERVVFWTAITFGSTLAAYVLRRFAVRVVSKKRPVAYELMVTGLMVLAVTPMVLGMMWIFAPGVCGGASCVGRIGLYVGLIAGAIFMLRRVVPGFEDLLFFVRDETGGLRFVAPSPLPVGDVLPVGPEPDSCPMPRLFRRLPDTETGTILHLTANGHFVTVTLDTGAHDIRMRFGDAVEEMDCVEGCCTHRSHWVSATAVTGHKRVDGKPVLVLVNGMEVPVSRTYRPGLEKAGLLPTQTEGG